MFDITKTKAVLWDLDDTLYSRVNAARQTFRGMLRELLYIDRSDAFIDEAVDYMMTKIYRNTMIHEDTFNALLQKYPSDKPYIRSVCVDYYFENISKYAEPFEEQIEVITKLREMGIKTAIVTNVAEDRIEFQRQKISALKIESLFDVVVMSGELGIHKPDRRIFETAANLLGVSTDQCIFVGDDPNADVAGALNSDMEVVWIDNWEYDGRFSDEPKVHRVKSVKEYFVF